MASVKQLARNIQDRTNTLPSGLQEPGADRRPLRQPPSDEAREEGTVLGAQSEVRRLTREFNRHGWQATSELQQEVEAALRKAVDDVRAAGHQVTRQMIDEAKTHAHFGKGHDQFRRVLLREAAVQAALQEAEENGVDMRNAWGKRGEARLAATSAGTSEYEAMYESALRALLSDKMVYVVTAAAYKRVGLDLVLSLSSLSDSFELKVSRDATVAQVIHAVQQDRLYRRPAGPGKKIVVKLVGPAGTLLVEEKLISHAVDCDGHQDEPEDEDAEFYPLSVLTGEEWREIGIPGKTRWMHLRENEFRDLFGMSKDAFGQLPDWKQIPLRKKHGLF